MGVMRLFFYIFFSLYCILYLVHGDCSETVFIGQVSDAVRDLVVTTFKAWKASIAICKPGVRYSEIGGVIEDIIKPKGYSSGEQNSLARCYL